MAIRNMLLLSYCVMFLVYYNLIIIIITILCYYYSAIISLSIFLNENIVFLRFNEQNPYQEKIKRMSATNRGICQVEHRQF